MEKVILPAEVEKQIPKLLELAERPLVRIVIDERASEVQLKLPAGALRDTLAVRSDVVFEARLNGSSFQLEVNVLDLECLATQFGTDVDGLVVNIVIRAVAGAELAALTQAAGEQGMKLLSDAIEFQLLVSGGGQELEVTDFGGVYMVKSIVLDEGLAERNVMAVLYDSERRTFTFVPTVAARLGDERSEMVMRMPHNSIYAVMEAEPIRFTDMSAHWAAPEVEYMASKRIVSGVSNTAYAPDRAITRAEFTALLVRALGLRVQPVASGDVFADVTASAWYASVVEAGVQAGLVRGMSESSFAPEEAVTREQMAVMLANSRAIATGETARSGAAASVLRRFVDAAELSPWAVDAMATAVAAGWIQGMGAYRLASADMATRAQAAVMLERLLREIGFVE